MLLPTYLRIIVVMYMREPRSNVPFTPVPVATWLAIATCVLLTLYLGVLPARVLNFASDSAREFLSDAATPAATLGFATKGR